MQFGNFGNSFIFLKVPKIALHFILLKWSFYSKKVVYLLYRNMQMKSSFLVNIDALRLSLKTLDNIEAKFRLKSI